MEFYKVIEDRKTIRRFSTEPIEAEKIRRILRAGIAAPTYNHRREWEFILLKDIGVRIAITELAENIGEGRDTKRIEKSLKNYDLPTKEMYLDAIPLQGKMILTAPEVLVICYKIKKPVEECHKIYELNDLASAWCCIENILLAMAAEKLYGVTYIPQDTKAIGKILNVPDEYEIPAIIPFGYPATDAVRCKQQGFNLDDKIHISSW